MKCNNTASPRKRLLEQPSNTSDLVETMSPLTHLVIRWKHKHRAWQELQNVSPVWDSQHSPVSFLTVDKDVLEMKQGQANLWTYQTLSLSDGCCKYFVLEGKSSHSSAPKDMFTIVRFVNVSRCKLFHFSDGSVLIHKRQTSNGL